MRLKQVLSIEQMKHLQELGLDTGDASMHWQYLPTADAIINGTDEIEEEPCLFVSQPNMKHEYPAYTLQDILDKLPPIIDEVYWLTLEVMDRQKNEWKIKYARINAEHECASFSSEKLIDVAYEMLCWCIENGYVGKEGD